MALAEAQRALGLNITEEQIAALRAQVDTIDFDAAAAYERRFRHDVMAHIHALGDAAPAGAPDHPPGGDELFRHRQRRPDLDARRPCSSSATRPSPRSTPWPAFAETWKDLPCLGYTHFQPAQLVTVGKRATLWCHELVLDLAEIERRLAGLEIPRGQGNDRHAGQLPGALRRRRCQGRRAGSAGGRRRSASRRHTPSRGRPTRGRSTPRCSATLAGIAESAHRFGTDLRLLAHEREVEEPFEAEQIGSSAMAYKRNPMRAERMCSLARFVLALAPAASQTAATQWLERTLDDSAIRRLDRAAGLPGRRRDPEPVSQRRARTGRPSGGDRAARRRASFRSWRPRTS